MNRKYYTDNIEDLTVEQIVEGILDGSATLKELRDTGNFDA